VVLQTLNDFVVMLVLVLQALDFLVLLTQVGFEGLDAFAQPDDFRLQDFDYGVVGDGIHGNAAAGVAVGEALMRGKRRRASCATTEHG
jgi:hypothetical protein